VTTTFGDLGAVADRHLQAPSLTGNQPLAPKEHAQVSAALAQCVHAVQLLWSTADHTHRPFRDFDSAWRRAGRELRAGLTVAARCLDRVVAEDPPEGAPCFAAGHLRAASVAIGASHDLLATHSNSTTAGAVDRTGMAAVIDGTAGRRAIADACAQHLKHLASTADHLGQVEGIQRPDREAALRAADALHASLRAIGTARILAPTTPEFLDTVRLVEPLRLHRVREDESPDELLREAILGVERLHRIALEEIAARDVERHSPGAMASVSAAMAAMHNITSRVLLHIAPVTHESVADSVHRDDTQNLSEAAAACERTAQSWAAVRVAWKGVRAVREDGPPDVIRTEASDLVTRIGRLAHGDPAWLPKAGASHQLRPAKELCADPMEAAGLLNGLQALTDGSRLVAHDHSQLVVHLASREQLLVPTRTLPEEFDVPLPWAAAPQHRVDDLRVALSDAWAASHDVSRLVGEANDPTRHLPPRDRDRWVAERGVEGQARSM
jgi:hypothetical protein